MKALIQTSTKKQLLVLLLGLGLCLARGFTQSASDFTVGLNAAGTGVIIRSYTGRAAQVTIPAQIEGLPVTEIGNDAFNGANISSVVIPATVTRIGINAFTETRLVSVTLPAGLKRIEHSTFAFCASLRTVVIPEGVTVIEESAFFECPALTAITLPSTIREIAGHAFAGCIALTTVTIPDSVGAIRFGTTWGESDGFEGCSRLNLASQAALRRRGYDGF